MAGDAGRPTRGPHPHGRSPHPYPRPDQARAVAAGGPGGGAVVVVGAASPLGAALARRLATDLAQVARGDASASPLAPARVVAVDVRLPAEDLGGARWARVDLRGPALPRLLDAEDAAVVVDVTLLPGARGGRGGGPPVGLHVVAAAQRARGVRRLVLASSTGVYGASPRAPSVRGEDAELAPPSGGAERRASEVEAALRAAGRRRPDQASAVLRLADVVGPGLRTPLGDWLEVPAVPCLWGHDPRLQVLHADDAVEALRLAALGDVTGVVNVAGEGVVTLQQAAALCGRPVLPVPAAALAVTARALSGRAVDPPWSDAARVLRSGRVVDLARMRADLGLAPRWTSRGAVEDLARGRGLAGPLSPEVRAAAAERVGRAVRGARGLLAAAGGPR
ncbi:NAD-dependent epimerase/dehydratase family protein [Pseudokineococcus sp. 1T1Z-3]|uniref:NAD-dependent epimerase/dehydratase family protein n=1 Tax=Pseudokineococcus sp. 1T1Z-3 TaxID=3132745 RepID=UPI0030A1684C